MDPVTAMGPLWQKSLLSHSELGSEFALIELTHNLPIFGVFAGTAVNFDLSVHPMFQFRTSRISRSDFFGRSTIGTVVSITHRKMVTWLRHEFCIDRPLAVT
jgi:hypothetical protein|tara:strand:- start:178 stop:483 length:306 start_codon:yes stop_codon:yes gene_type:complete